MKKLLSFITLFGFIFLLASCDQSTSKDTTENESSIISTNSTVEQSTTKESSSVTETSENSSDLASFTVTFKNYDGEILQESSVYMGSLPKYEGATPTRDSDGQYNYTFSGWDSYLRIVTGKQEYTATYTKTAITYNITYDLDGGIIDEGNPTSYNADLDDITLINPTKEGYTFIGWEYNDNVITTIDTSNGCDMSLEALWTYYTLTTTINNPKAGSITTLKDEKITEGKKVTIEAEANDGFVFNGWYNGDNEVSKDSKYTFNMPDKNITYEAIFTANKYTMTTLNDSSVEILGVTSGNEYDCGTELSLSVENVAEGYSVVWTRSDDETFIGNTYVFEVPAADLVIWCEIKANNNTPYEVRHYLQNIEDDKYPEEPYEVDNLTGTTDTLTDASKKDYIGFESPSVTQVNINGDGSTVINLYYERKDYIVSASRSIRDGGTVSGSGRYKYDQEVKLVAEPNEGYSFTGWYLNDEQISTDDTITFKMPDKYGLSYVAVFVPIKYKITIDNQAEGVTLSGVTSGDEYDFSTEITLFSSDVPSNNTIRWERDDNQAYVGDSYKFNVPAYDLTITVTIVTSRTYTRAESNKIIFGSYPQTLVDEEVESELVSELNDLASNGTWIDYNYIYDSEVKSYMFYQDIDTDNDGLFDYRGVYLTQYRPQYLSWKIYDLGSTYQDDNGYDLNHIYWFKYEPIVWNILKEENGQALLIADLILDSQEFYSSDSSITFAQSTIRSWLNDNFYNTAFTELDKKSINLSTIDGSDNNIFLLSMDEVKNVYYTLGSTRVAYGTDYAKCQGLHVTIGSYGYCDWWLRSPSGARVYGYGQLPDGTNLYSTVVGARPVLYLNL